MSSKKVTKFDLVEAITRSSSVKNRQVVQEVVDCLLVQLKDSLKSGNTIELRGFGTFEPRLRKGRKEARDPRTGRSLSVAPHYVAAFRSGQDLKKSLWEIPVESEK